MTLDIDQFFEDDEDSVLEDILPINASVEESNYNEVSEVSNTKHTSKLRVYNDNFVRFEPSTGDEAGQQDSILGRLKEELGLSGANKEYFERYLRDLPGISRRASDTYIQESVRGGNSRDAFYTQRNGLV